MITRRYYQLTDPVTGNPVTVVRTRPFTDAEKLDLFDNGWTDEDTGFIRTGVWPVTVLVGFDN